MYIELPADASCESSIAGAVVYLVSDNLLGNPCTTFLFFLKNTI